MITTFSHASLASTSHARYQVVQEVCGQQGPPLKMNRSELRNGHWWKLLTGCDSPASLVHPTHVLSDLYPAGDSMRWIYSRFRNSSTSWALWLQNVQPILTFGAHSSILGSIRTNLGNENHPKIKIGHNFSKIGRYHAILHCLKVPSRQKFLLIFR